MKIKIFERLASMTIKTKIISGVTAAAVVVGSTAIVVVMTNTKPDNLPVANIGTTTSTTEHITEYSRTTETTTNITESQTEESQNTTISVVATTSTITTTTTSTAISSAMTVPTSKETTKPSKKHVIMPSFIGLTHDEAVQKAIQTGVGAFVTSWEYNETVPKGKIIQQNIPEGKEVVADKSSRFELTASLGPAPSYRNHFDMSILLPNKWVYNELNEPIQCYEGTISIYINKKLTFTDNIKITGGWDNSWTGISSVYRFRADIDQFYDTPCLLQAFVEIHETGEKYIIFSLDNKIGWGIYFENSMHIFPQLLVPQLIKKVPEIPYYEYDEGIIISFNETGGITTEYISFLEE